MNALASTSHEAVATLGALIGVGLGPGDPELVTVKAARLIGAANVVAFFAKRGRSSHARAIAAPYLTPGCEEIALLYPVTTEIPFDQPEYVSSLQHFYEDCVMRIRAGLEAGRDVRRITDNVLRLVERRLRLVSQPSRVGRTKADNVKRAAQGRRPRPGTSAIEK